MEKQSVEKKILKNFSESRMEKRSIEKTFSESQIEKQSVGKKIHKNFSEYRRKDNIQRTLEAMKLSSDHMVSYRGRLFSVVNVDGRTTTP